MTCFFVDNLGGILATIALICASIIKELRVCIIGFFFYVFPGKKIKSIIVQSVLSKKTDIV